MPALCIIGLNVPDLFCFVNNCRAGKEPQLPIFDGLKGASVSWHRPCGLLMILQALARLGLSGTYALRTCLICRPSWLRTDVYDGIIKKGPVKGPLFIECSGQSNPHVLFGQWADHHCHLAAFHLWHVFDLAVLCNIAGNA